RLVMLDNMVAAATGLLVAGLSWRQALPPPLLLTIVFVSSLTFPLSNGGARSLFPILAPRHLWERANALDSSGHVIATLLGASPDGRGDSGERGGDGFASACGFAAARRGRDRRRRGGQRTV